jgi:H+-transporting ATPase
MHENHEHQAAVLSEGAAADQVPTGLSSEETRFRLVKFGPNATPETDIGLLRLVMSKFFAPVPFLLEAAIVLQLVLREYIEAAIIAALLVFNAVLGFLHEFRARATIAALKSRLALSASVRRDAGIFANDFSHHRA